ncbi:glycosyltransferase [Mucilaginibacter kameinonensis]|uniref:glycosyltransferase n=1 Tax=Mucilaginibacter kameinonensis TaxID=452286 RepID=UPI000EF76AE1|nr:glycosyltransferase [Mucilaginibacter kameinonensis]
MEIKKYSFVTFLGTDSFLPGVIALYNSLSIFNKKYPLLVLTTDLVSNESLSILDKLNIQHKHVERIQNPNVLENDQRNFRHMYTKLRIFELAEFDKIVYIDADMLVCSNIETLFNSPHMSSVVAGALNPGCSDWKDLNAGLLVVVPDKTLAGEMYSLVPVLKSNDGSDQGFLHSFYSNWANDKQLHLDHKYNVPAPDVDIYSQLNHFKFSYRNGLLDTDIAVIHYWGYHKPWHYNGRLLNIRSQRVEDRLNMLWWDFYKPADRKLRVFYYTINLIRRKFSALIKRL